MKPTYPRNNYGKCLPFIWTPKYEHNSLPLRPSYRKSQRINYRRYGGQESWSKRHPSTHSNEAIRKKWKPYTNPMKKGWKKKRIKERNYHRKDK